MPLKSSEISSKLENLHRLCDELESLEKTVHSKNLQVPKEWFWHSNCIKTVRRFQESALRTLTQLNPTSEYHLRDFIEQFQKLLDELNQILKPIEKDNFFYSPEQAERINTLLRNLDYYLIHLVQEVKLLEGHNSGISDAEKKKILMELGLNIFRYPEITEMLLFDWSIIEEMLKIFGDDNQRNEKIYNVRGVMPSFFDLIFHSISIEDVGNVLNSPHIRPYLHKGSYFFEEHGAGQVAVKVEQFEEAVRNLKMVLLLLSMIISRGTVGEHLAVTVIGKDIPALRKTIRNNDDLEIIYKHTALMFKDYAYSALYITAELIPAFAELFYQNRENLFSALYDIIRTGNSEYQGPTVLRYCIPHFTSFIHNPKTLRWIGLRLIRIDNIWVKKLKEIARDSYSHEISSVLGQLMPYVRDAKDLVTLFQILEEISSSTVNILIKILNLLSKYGIIHSLYDFKRIKGLKKCHQLGKMELSDTEAQIVFEFIETAIGTTISVNGGLKGNEVVDLIDLCLNFIDREIGNKEKMGQLAIFTKILTLVVPYRITLRELQQNDGLMRRFRELAQMNIAIYESDIIIEFIQTIVNARGSHNVEELLHLIDIILNMLNKEIRGNRQKIKQLRNITPISKSIFRWFGDYLLYVIEKAPAHFMKILFNIFYLTNIGENVTRELLQLSRICRTYRLLVNENIVERINPQEIENTYLFLTGRLERKPDIDKLRKNLRKFGTEHSKTAFEWINNAIMNLSIEYFSKVTEVKVVDAFASYCGVPLPTELLSEKYRDDAINALLTAKKCTTGRNIGVAKIFISELCLKNMVPFKKYPEAFPFNHPKNVEFMRKMQSRGINLEDWIKGFKRDYPPIFTNATENAEKIIAEHIAEVRKHYAELKLEVEEKDIFEKFNEIKNDKNTSLVQDIKQHLHAIQSLRGRRAFVSNIRKVMIYVETEPLKILQMGNVVSGSCLALAGGNSWTTITNALDVNKKVLYAVSENGQILGRRLITMIDNGQIIQYQVYNNEPQIDLETLFQQFTIELAKRCHTTVANGGETSVLVGESWYAGTAIQPFTVIKVTQPSEIPKRRPSRRPSPVFS